MIGNYYRDTKITMLKSVGLALVLLFFIHFITGCGENNKSGSLMAVLSAQESPNVPGRIKLDPRGSTPGEGQKLVSFTIEVIDTATEETVFGPKTVSANADSALLREYFPKGEYLARLTVTATNVVIDESAAIRNGVLEQQFTDTVEETFSADAIIIFPEADSCEATCSASTTNNPAQKVCTLPTDCFTLGLVQDVLSQAKTIEPTISETTTMWFQAYGGSGGDGTDNSFGGGGGQAGPGGFAQTITTIAEFNSTYGNTKIFYYLGAAGIHDDSGGSGGASTIVTNVEPETGTPLNLSTIILLAGGGGGGGEGATLGPAGTDGGSGGFAYSTTVGDSNVGIGGSESSGMAGGGQGGGTNSCTEGLACGGITFGSCNNFPNTGDQGFGGESGGSSDNPGPRGWINATPQLEDNAGNGSNGIAECCDSGGGGGGFGGGSGGSECTDSGGTFSCVGGGGGGSYAAGSTTTDSDAPSTNPNNSSNGEVIIVFNEDPSM